MPPAKFPKRPMVASVFSIAGQCIASSLLLCGDGGGVEGLWDSVDGKASDRPATFDTPGCDDLGPRDGVGLDDGERADGRGPSKGGLGDRAAIHPKLYGRVEWASSGHRFNGKTAKATLCVRCRLTGVPEGLEVIHHWRQSCGTGPLKGPNCRAVFVIFDAHDEYTGSHPGLQPRSGHIRSHHQRRKCYRGLYQAVRKNKPKQPMKAAASDTSTKISTTEHPPGQYSCRNVSWSPQKTLDVDAVLCGASHGNPG